MTDDKAIRSSYTFLTSTLKSVKGVSLNVANKVYLKKGAELKSGIKKDAKNVFQASLKQLDFNDKEAAVDTINNWVAQKTKNKIKDIVGADMITENTRMLLVNAIYFQGTWAKKFTVSETKNSYFHVNETTTISVPMMSSKKNYFNYGESQELEAQLLQMKYKGSDASMIIVLPDEVEGLKSVLQKLASGHNIMADIETMKSTKLDVWIPKFRVETTIDLKTLLPELGIKSIFDGEKADIDMLKSNEKLFVSDAIQKALIIVDENGTEAAAATVSIERRPCCGTIIERFEANHPFLYLLTACQIPVFIGIYEGSEYAKTSITENEMILSDFIIAKVQALCSRLVHTFIADRPFLYLLTARKIPLFIGIYGGSEYAEITSNGNDIMTESETLAEAKTEKICYSIIQNEQNGHTLTYVTPTHDMTTHDTPSHNTPAHDTHTLMETQKTLTSHLCARCEIQ
ncbi:hypothetical protein MSG28_008904 [Choristoneura fumiferana]|uniref:Uncharacterized protein n=1 Tax=Choristoneura fumiferana TaxID=7141 RepID=A0ACC0J8J9_CHOFU|nr:hypothetical protein MSG28_008904 [Choristoneura fumiferana]